MRARHWLIALSHAFVLHLLAQSAAASALQTMNYLAAALFKLASTFMFATMSTIARSLGQSVPAGEIVFVRGLIAVFIVLGFAAWNGRMWDAVRTDRLSGHLLRGSISLLGMFSLFMSLARIPVVDTTAISFLAPLITVVLAALLLKEHVRIYRWSAVLIGFLGGLVMLWPYLVEVERGGSATMLTGVGFALLNAACIAGATVQIRILSQTETTTSIMFYASAMPVVAGLLTLPFGWIVPDTHQMVLLVAIGVCGSFGQIFLTEGIRRAPASFIAPFDYTLMIWAFILGYVFLGELPKPLVVVGALIVAGAGLFVIWRERRLGVARAAATATAPDVR